ncbi:hypothetical protein [Polaribacter sp. Asnod6-C07]|uniref:hypothetical protein n=1 Tax=Polaribacter sp. Asnod6-C07 TaxID=3160582 RepID=UPI003869D05C
MILKNILIVINCLGYKQFPDAYDLLMFGLGSFILIIILGLYYNRIPESNRIKSDLQNPIYQSKDVLFQTRLNKANYLVSEKRTSTGISLMICLIIAVVIFTPVYKLLGTGYFL